MKVFAEYIKYKELYFRRNTLLQFGDSWDLIGNIVLANPGSAKPKNVISSEELLSINGFYQKYRQQGIFEPLNYHEFNDDPTMRMVAKIFNGLYIGREFKLNGTIQLFNTFNIKNQNLKSAITQIDVDSDLLFSRNVFTYFNDKPTYFGFGKDVLKDPILRQAALHIFNQSSDVIRNVYHPNFSDNAFYHPMYINRAFNQASFEAYKNNVLSQIANRTSMTIYAKYLA